jgi:mannosyltransferase OCH1-like enzyme
LFFVDDPTMENIIRAECSPRERAAFFRLNPQYWPARADFLRYHLLRSRGGLWLDATSGFANELDQNLAKYRPLPPLILSHWGWPNQHENIPEDIHKSGEIQNWMMMSVKNHPCWNFAIGYVVRQIEEYTPAVGVGKFAVLKITGPIALSRALYPLLPGWPHLLLKDTRKYDKLNFCSTCQRQYGIKISVISRDTCMIACMSVLVLVLV